MRCGAFELTYCTNVHPGESWVEVFDSLRRYVPALRERLAPEGPFGLGLRLSDRAARELLEGDRLARFREFLEAHGLYVALINGFPFGAFHRRVVKAQVFAPDWGEAARVEYTLRLVRLLAALLPAGLDGGISTSPLSYKRWGRCGDPEAWSAAVGGLVCVAEAMARLRRETGQLLHLDIEPEPDGWIENSAETVACFEERLLREGAPLLARRLETGIGDAEAALREHVRICYDTCHFAVEYETPEAAIERLERAGIRIGRVQASSALRAPLPPSEAERRRLAERLAPFAESTYLHQVVERREDGSLRRHADLVEALPAIGDPAAREWRVHFHVPLFVAEYGSLGSTRADVEATFRRLRAAPFTRHVEVETYTWEVLPREPGAPPPDLLDSIERELRWARAALEVAG